MAITLTRTETDLMGSVASPASVAATTAVTSTALDLTVTTNGQIYEAALGVHLIAGASAPTTAVTVGYYYSLDGTNYYLDGGLVSVTLANSTAYDLNPYRPPAAAKKAEVIVTGGATNAITAYVQGVALSIS